MPCLKTHIQREYTSYLYGALPLCVVLAHEDSRPWYLEHYVQLHSEYSPSSGEQPHLDFADSFGYQRVLECQTLDWTAVAEAGPSVIDLIRDRISAGHHGTVFVDDDHLRGREFVRLHEYLVFGYDDERREIAVVGFGGRPRIFRELRFSYDDFTTAFRQAKAAVDEGRSDVRYPVQLLRPRPLPTASALPASPRHFRTISRAHRVRTTTPAPGGPHLPARHRTRPISRSTPERGRTTISPTTSPR